MLVCLDSGLLTAFKLQFICDFFLSDDAEELLAHVLKRGENIPSRLSEKVSDICRERLSTLRVSDTLQFRVHLGVSAGCIFGL